MSKKRVYIVQFSMSSPNKMLHSEYFEESNQSLQTYYYSKETRNEIQRIRQKYKYPIYRDTVKFPSDEGDTKVQGLRLIGGDAGDSILKLTDEADQELKKIDPNLYALTRLVPIDMNEVARGEIYGDILHAIKSKFYDEAFTRINKIVLSDKEVGSRTKKSLKKLLIHLEKLNILDDEDITNRIQNIRALIEKESINELHDELNTEFRLYNPHSRFNAITPHHDEIIEDQTLPEYVPTNVSDLADEAINRVESQEEELQEASIIPSFNKNRFMNIKTED